MTNFYLDVIKQAYVDNGYEVEDREVKDIKASEKDTVICARILDAIKLFGKNKKCKYVYWVQGIEPEESYMQHQSKLRKMVLNYLECKVLKKADYLFFVSESMKEYLEKKHKFVFDKKKYHVMPCFNTAIHKDAFYVSEKYSSNNFVYAGSLSKWQKFDETVDLFKKIKEEYISDAELYVYTFDVAGALATLNKKSVNAKEVKCLKPEEMPEYLSKAKYGFIIRDDDPVNNVATPTKISTYLSCGLIPIYSGCLSGMTEMLSNTRYKIVAKDKMIFLDRINASDIYEEYNKIFQAHYSVKKHIQLFKDDLIKITP